MEFSDRGFKSDSGQYIRFKWFFRNSEGRYNINPFKQKSKFNPRKKYAAIEFCLSQVEKELSLDNSKSDL